MIAQDFIYQSFRKIGQNRPGYVPQPELLGDALNEWIAFYDQLGAERNSHWSNPVYQHAVSGPGSATNGNGYTVGPSGADWIQPRPESIIRANLVMTNVGPQPIYLPLRPVSQEEWAALAIQQIPGINVTSLFWYDPQFPNGVFNVFPPLNGNSIQIYQWGVLTPPATLGATYAAPPGYQDAIVYGLAERLYHMATKSNMVAHPVSYQIIAGKAHAALEKVRNVNRPIPKLINDSPRGNRAGGFYDSFVTYTGEPY